MALVPILNISPTKRLIHPTFGIGIIRAQRRTVRGRVVVVQAEEQIPFEHTRGIVDAADAAGAGDLPPVGQHGHRRWRARIDLDTVPPSAR